MGVALTLSTITGLLSAQHRDELRRTVQELRERYRETENLLDTLGRVTTRPESVSLAGATLYVHPALADSLRQIISEVHSRLRQRLGDTDLELLGGWRLVVRSLGQNIDPNSIADRGHADSSARVEHIWLFNGPPFPQQVLRLEERVVNHVTRLAGTRLNSWAPGWASVLRSPQPKPYYRTAYIDIVSFPSMASRFCLQGDLTWCAKALGLAPVDHPWRDLTSPEDRRLLIGRWHRSRFRDRQSTYRRCLQQADDSACLELSQDLGLPRPISAPGRSSLIHTVKHLGGDGAVSRLLADTTQALPHRFEAAATVPQDTLLREWRRRVMVEAPVPRPVVSAATWVSLLGIVLLGSVALRSSRWR